MWYAICDFILFSLYIDVVFIIIFINFIFNNILLKIICLSLVYFDIYYISTTNNLVSYLVVGIILYGFC